MAGLLERRGGNLADLASTKSKEMQSALKGLIARSALANVSFKEITSPVHDPSQDDYVVEYEAIFEPSDLMHAYLKILVAEDGQIGLGLETRERLAHRLKVALRWQKLAFAAGRELAPLSVDEVLRFVSMVAQGKFVLKANIGLMGLSGVKAVVTPDVYATLQPQNDRAWDWLHVSAKMQQETFCTKVLKFQPW